MDFHEIKPKIFKIFQRLQKLSFLMINWNIRHNLHSCCWAFSKKPASASVELSPLNVNQALLKVFWGALFWNRSLPLSSLYQMRYLLSSKILTIFKSYKHSYSLFHWKMITCRKPTKIHSCFNILYHYSCLYKFFTWLDFEKFSIVLRQNKISVVAIDKICCQDNSDYSFRKEK